jgi:hypothetical protein
VGYPTFAVRPAVLTVKPGDVLESESLWGEWYEKAGGKWPGEVGPIAIEGAEPGDTLVVEMLKIRPNRDTAVSTQGGRFGAPCPTAAPPLLNDVPAAGTSGGSTARMTGTVTFRSAMKQIMVPCSRCSGRGRWRRR